LDVTKSNSPPARKQTRAFAQSELFLNTSGPWIELHPVGYYHRHMMQLGPFLENFPACPRIDSLPTDGGKLMLRVIERLAKAVGLK